MQLVSTFITLIPEEYFKFVLFCLTFSRSYSFPKFISPRHAYHLLTESEVITGESQTEALMF